MKLYYPVQPISKYKIDSTFLDLNYYRNYKMWHTGIDINGVGGWDTDLGDPVYCVYDGIVTEACVGGSTWGKIVRIWHPGLNIYTRNAHLKDIRVRAGQVIKRGTLIGTIGKGANNIFPAHLHFDMMKKVPGIPFDYGVVTLGATGITEVKRVYIDPLGVFRKFGVE